MENLRPKFRETNTVFEKLDDMYETALAESFDHESTCSLCQASRYYECSLRNEIHLKTFSLWSAAKTTYDNLTRG